MFGSSSGDLCWSATSPIELNYMAPLHPLICWILLAHRICILPLYNLIDFQSPSSALLNGMVLKAFVICKLVSTGKDVFIIYLICVLYKATANQLDLYHYISYVIITCDQPGHIIYKTTTFCTS